jgi:topoisomerase IV subunit B
VDEPSPPWPPTSHDWTATVDAEHLAEIRRDPASFAPGGLLHLVLEVVAYAADEAEYAGGGQCVVTLHGDGSVSVAEDGRGTDTRYDAQGRPIRKPIMATRDLRYFDHPGVQTLPDGHPRRGISVVAALSEWLVHTNRRHDGAWSQRYEYGLPVTDLQPVAGTDGTGTTVDFRPDPGVGPSPDLTMLTGFAWPQLRLAVVDERPTWHSE